jgi:hypothetical protein
MNDWTMTDGGMTRQRLHADDVFVTEEIPADGAVLRTMVLTPEGFTDKQVADALTAHAPWKHGTLLWAVSAWRLREHGQRDADRDMFCFEVTDASRERGGAAAGSFGPWPGA